MSEAELMFPLEIEASEGRKPGELVFELPAGVILRDRYQHALEDELRDNPLVIDVRAYGQMVVVDMIDEETAQDTELQEYVVGKIREVLLRASLGR